MKKIILGSSNKHKIKEFQDIFRNFNIQIEELPSSIKFNPPPENGVCFSENADIKAIYYSKLVNDPVIADDSGLCVNALEGMPGIYSSRFSGEKSDDVQNNKKLMRLMADKTDRNARFICCVSLALNGKIIERGVGEVRGIIIQEPRGPDGFGYDPLFLYVPLNKTFSELSMSEKSTLSHRYQACKNIAQYIS